MKRSISKSFKKLMACLLAAAMVVSSAAPVLSQEVQAATTSGISITDSNGWLESAYVEWKPVSNAKGYNVYVKSAGSSAYTKLDGELIRQYSGYWRADALGLKAGSYVMKVEALLKDGSVVSAQTGTMTVAAHDRSGFAFSGESTMKTGSGAYNDDGTLKAGAQVIYVTPETAKTVKLDVIISSNGKTASCTGIGEILTARQKGYDKTPLAIRFVGQVTKEAMSGQLNSSGYLQVKGKASYAQMNMTIEGVGEDATAYGWGVLIRNCGNIEVRNLGIMLFPDDGISLDTGNCNVWVHNNDIFYGTAGSDKDQAKGDGSADVKGASTWVTVSYNHFWDSGKCSLCGMSDSTEFFVTYHHNWFDHSDSRHPRIRVASVHVYNNYFDGNAKYGVGTTKGSSAFVEANYFRNCKNPMMSSLQGTDALGDGTFSGENGGMIKAYANQIEGAASLIYANSDAGTRSQNSKEFDAYLASSRNEKVPSSYKTVAGGTVYNNFDTGRDIGVSASNVHSASQVKDVVTTLSGRMNGGDFTWTFNNAVDDESYAVNTALMDKIRAYKSGVVSIGSSAATGTQTEVPTTKPTEAPTVKPTEAPTTKPTEAPTVKPTEAPTQTPSGGNVDLGSLSSTGAKTNLVDKEDSYFTNAIYVSPTGSANGAGTKNSPMSLESAIAAVNGKKGATILLMGGTYKFSTQITIDTANSGTASSYKVLKACKGATVKLDFSSQSYSNDTATNLRGIQLNGSYWYMEGFEVYGAADNGMMISGSHNIVENCVLNSNRDTGLQISRRASSVTDYKDWPSYNSIINCTSKNNCDPATYENADGFAAKLTCGDGNVFDGCIAYNNSDDGWDCFAKEATGPIGVITIRNCIAMRNGKTESGETKSSCDGNGFKLGGSGVGTPHIVINCIAIENLHHGFTDNNNPSALTVKNCTAFNNNLGGGKNNFSLYRCKDALVSNCISYTTNNTSDKYVNLSASYSVLYNSGKWYQVTNLQKMDTGSSATRGTVMSTGVKASDFISASIPAVGTDFHKVWRNADGTINTKGVALISSSSAFGKFSTDGGVIGARFGSDNKTTVTSVAISNAQVEQPTEKPTEKPTEQPTEKPTEQPTQAPSKETVVHNFTTSGKSSSFFAITGNLSTAKGIITYEGMTLKQCLKMESATKISFTAESDAVLTLVFNKANSSNVKVDGTTYTLQDGVLTLSVKKGSHTITKADTANLFYMSVGYNASSTEKPTEAPTEKPTEKPTEAPTEKPTEKPTEAPTEKPTEKPTEAPTEKPTEKPTEAPTQAPSKVHNFTVSGTNSSYYTISGNLSDAKGSVTYEGLNLTQCLKMETSTKVTFTTEEYAQLVLVLNKNNGTSIKVDGKTYDSADGIIRFNLNAGTHTITKADAANLYYIEIKAEDEQLSSPQEPQQPRPQPTYLVVVQQNGNWGSGLTSEIHVDNTGKENIDNWTLEFDYADNITGIWNAQIISHTGNHYVVKGLPYNANLAAGSKLMFGIMGTPAVYGVTAEWQNVKLY